MTSDHVKVQIHTENIPKKEASLKLRRHKQNKRTSFQERLLRNSCLACAVLLGILALSNVERPWAQKASGSIEKALTMKIDLDQSIGQMHFVQKIMPESALVFFNLGSSVEFQKPVDGKLSHAFSDLQPYLMFECSEDQDIIMPKDGVISAVSPLSDGSWGILIDHGNGVESVTAGLKALHISAGEDLKQGEIIGLSCSKVYFELHEGGIAVDPTSELGL